MAQYQITVDSELLNQFFLRNSQYEGVPTLLGWDNGTGPLSH